jgi:hypothetical protein
MNCYNKLQFVAFLYLYLANVNNLSLRFTSFCEKKYAIVFVKLPLYRFSTLVGVSFPRMILSELMAIALIISVILFKSKVATSSLAL